MTRQNTNRCRSKVTIFICVLTTLSLRLSSALMIQSTLTRRNILNIGLSTGSIVFPALVWAKEGQPEGERSGLLSAAEAGKLLKPVPTFTIVDKAGVPFFVVGEDAKVTSYFFTTYTEAVRILNLAKTSTEKSIAEAKREGKLQAEAGTNPWKDARISTMPLDFAVTLTTKSNAAKGGGTYFQVAPAEEDIEDALELTGNDSLPEGKVPLFYDEDFTIEIDGVKKTPLYFRRAQLKSEYQQFGDKSREVKMSVTELFAVLSELVKPGGSDLDLKSLVFIPPNGSEQKKLECERKGGKAPPFVFGQRNIVL